jgi:hypothetical protein
MDPQGYSFQERSLFEQEVEQILRTELPTVREEEVRAAARRAAARELEQQRDLLRGELNDEVVAITDEPADQRGVAAREAPSKLLLGSVLLLLLLFTLAVWGRLPWSASALGAPGTGRASSASANDYEAILGAPGAAGNDASIGAFAVSPSGTPAGSTVSGAFAATGSSASPTIAASASPPQAALLPQTGVATGELFVDALFGRVYWRQGGAQRFGRPTSALVRTDGGYAQTFEHARFEYRAEHAGTQNAIHIEIIE